MFALAHATGKVGRFTLIERWRNNERLLAPQENPLKVLRCNFFHNQVFFFFNKKNLLSFQILMKWGEYSSDVQFILQRSDQPKVQSPDQAAKNPASSPPQANESPKKAKSTFDEKSPVSPFNEPNPMNNPTPEDIKTNEPRRTDLIGIVKGMQKNGFKSYIFFPNLFTM